MPVFTRVTHYKLAKVNLMTQSAFIFVLLFLLATSVTNSLCVIMPVALLHAADCSQPFVTVVALNAIPAIPLTLIDAMTRADSMRRLVAHATHEHVLLIPWLAALLACLAFGALPSKPPNQLCRQLRVTAPSVYYPVAL